MTTNFELTVKSRSDIGKGASRRLRRLENQVPAIIYGAGKDPEMISIIQDDIMHALENEAFYSHILTLKIDKKNEQVVLKALQRHPWKKQILHADFLRVKAGEELQMTIPLHFIGEEIAPGVKIDGGLPSHNLTEIEVRCLPKHLPEYIEVDMSQLELNGSIHLTDLKLPEGITIVALMQGEDNDQPVAAIHTPRKVEEVEETAAPEAAETEITSEKAEEESAGKTKEPKKD